MERVWGPKRFFTFYLITAIGAVIFTGVINFYELSQIQAYLNAEDIRVLDRYIQSGEFNLREYGEDLTNEQLRNEFTRNFKNLKEAGLIPIETNVIEYWNYSIYNIKSSLGASGALLGLLAGFVILFPNTELMLLFPPIPIKAKYFVIGYAVIELYLGFSNNPGDNVAHFAHLGGALIGILILLYWQKGKSNFF